jgi:AAA domain-containing protein
MISKDELIKEANKNAVIDSPYRVSVLYGDYGKRKTTTACSMVSERGLLLSTDDSWKVLLNERHKDIYSKMKIINLEGIKQLEYVELDGYDTIVWDTVSQSVEVFLDLLYDKSDWGGKYREQLKTTSQEIKGLEVLAPVDYRVTRDYLRPAFNRLFHEVNANIIFTSQMVEPLPGLGSGVSRPAIPASTFKIIGTRADLIVNLRPENKNFVADLTEGSLSYLAKSRIEGLQGKMGLDAFVAKYKEIVFK